jgi:PAS domain S-box-containing protein
MTKAKLSATGPFFVKSVEQWMQEPSNPVLREGIRKRLLNEKDANEMTDAVLLSPAGEVQVTGNSQSDPVGPVTLLAVLTDMYRCARGKVHIDAVSGVWGAEGAVLGAIVLRLEPEKMLFPLIRFWPTPSPSSETLLVRREGEEVVVLNELRHETNTPLVLRWSLARSDSPAVQVVLGKEGRFRGRDYRGVEVLSDLRPVPDSPWFMVAKVDMSEIMDEARQRGGVIALFLSVGILLAALSLSVIYRRRQAGLYRTLYEAERTARKAEETFRIEERKAEQAMQESERRYRTLADSGQALIWTANLDKKCDYFNQPWLTFTGRTLEQEYGDGWAEGVHPDDLKACFETFVTAFDRREPFTMFYRLRRHDGEYRWLQDHGVPRFDSAGQFLGYIGHCLDVNDQKRAEKEREILEHQLLQSQKMEAVGRLAGGVAHDFNNMLQVIKGYAEMLLVSTDPQDPKASDIREVLKATQRSGDLTRQLLAFARKQTMAPRVLNVNEAVGDLLKMLGRLIGEDIQLQWRQSSDAGCIRMDPGQLSQILTNLVVNARDAVRAGGRIVIEASKVEIDGPYCRTHEGFEPGLYVRLAVSDNGTGMDKDTVLHLFEPFFTTKPKGKGSGLGLATVYGIVKQNKGFINVYSEPGVGTTFKIYLASVAEAALPSREQAAKAVVPLGGETVLLVEDEAILLALVRRMLEQFGYTVLAASGPVMALKLVAEHAGKIDLLVTDVIMPEMSGRELWKRLAVTLPACKVLFMSGYTANIIDRHGLLDKDVHFLEKPFSKDALAAKLRELLAPEPLEPLVSTGS